MILRSPGTGSDLSTRYVSALYNGNRENKTKMASRNRIEGVETNRCQVTNTRYVLESFRDLGQRRSQCFQCTSSSSTQAAGRRCAGVQTTLHHALLTISAAPDAQIARSDEYGTFTWEEPSTPTQNDESNGMLADPIARSSEPNTDPNVC